MMTLDEAIKHAEEVANDMVLCCNECAEEHRQLAEWLKELRDIAAFLDTKEMESNADVIRTAIDLLKYLNPECHSKVSEFEWKRRMKNE